MKKCPFCGAELAENARFCLYCMAQLDEKSVISARNKKKRTRLFLIVLVIVLAVVAVIAAFFSRCNGESSYESSFPQETSAVENGSQGVYDGSEDTSDSDQNENAALPEPLQPIVYKYRDSIPGDELAGLSVENAVTITGVETVSENGVYVIPESIDGKKVFAVAQYAFSEEHIKDTVKTVVVPKTVKNIENYAFFDCCNMTDLFLCSEAVAGSPAYYLPPKEKCNETIIIHASADCNDRNFRTYKSMYSYETWAGNDIAWVFEEWNVENAS